MKFLPILLMLIGVSYVSQAQQVYQIRADSVRIYSNCDTAELIIENRTKAVPGFLFNKGNGRTEFRKINLKKIDNTRIAIPGQDTLDLTTMSGMGVDTIYRNGDYITYLKNSTAYNVSAPLSSETLQSVTARGFVTNNNIQFNKSPANPSNGLVWVYNTDSWKIFVESLQDTPPGNMVFESADNDNEGWIFRNIGNGSSNGIVDVASLGRDRFLYKGDTVWHRGNHPAGTALAPVLTGANVLAGLTTNGAGHVTSATVRALTPANIGAAPQSGSAWYIQTQQAAPQTANFYVAGTGAISKLKTYGVTGAGQLEIYGGTLDPNDIKNRRWSFTRNNAESGLQTGSDLGINRHDSNGILIDTPLRITRSRGIVEMANGFIAASSSRIRGLATGNANTSYLAFMEKNDTVRAGYVGKVSSVNGDVSLLSDNGNISLGAFGGGQFTLSRAFLMVSTGNILLTDTISNMINYGTAGVALPTLRAASAGTKLLLYSRATDTSTNFAIGVESGATWFSVPRSSLDYSWKYYAGTTLVSRLTGQGGQEWNGQGRFKGWYTSGADPANSPAAEIGFTNGCATLIGCNRSTNAYTPLRLMGGSTLTDFKVFDIDATGYRFQQLPNAAVLSTDANGYLTKTLTTSTAATANTLALRDASGNLNATGFFQSSRASLKKNIRSFNEDALALLMQVQVKQFIYKDDKQENVRVGIIADSTDWHFSTAAHDRFDTNSSLAITMKAVQELNQLLKKENDAMKAENKILTEKLEEVLKRVSAIEQSVKKN
ncbi:tail fiber domain-containing protein [Chitinophaga sp. RAB17]|uniref:tail fiber domain-containing protein n=1 Tax=Chitinophaga sp. RAB17 TaxID=3233049 RepID=UPI003F934EB6